MADNRNKIAKDEDPSAQGSAASDALREKEEEIQKWLEALPSMTSGENALSMEVEAKKNYVEHVLKGITSYRERVFDIEQVLQRRVWGAVEGYIPEDQKKQVQARIKDDLRHVSEVSAIKALRIDYARHLARRDMLADKDRFARKPRWQGGHKEGIKASEFLKRHYAQEFEAGLRITDIQTFDPQLYKALRNEASRTRTSFEEMGLPGIHQVAARRRDIMASLIGDAVQEPDFSSFFTAIQQPKSRADDPSTS